MLNKNVNCYNISIISTFSEHITFFRTLSIDIWQLKCQRRQTNKTKDSKLFSVNFSELSNFSSSLFLREATLESKIAVTNRNSSAFLLDASKTFFNVELFSHFLQTFLELILAIVVVYQLSTKYCVYIMCLYT